MWILTITNLICEDMIYLLIIGGVLYFKKPGKLNDSSQLEALCLIWSTSAKRNQNIYITHLIQAFYRILHPYTILIPTWCQKRVVLVKLRKQALQLIHSNSRSSKIIQLNSVLNAQAERTKLAVWSSFIRSRRNLEPARLKAGRCT